mmetsp:Transcript_23743/g.23428  ORF Transcript_23743/g.23428 Transcript_23743/m.23428 type:complete len:195 (+) Transcript_23743:162-746(+)
MKVMLPGAMNISKASINSKENMGKGMLETQQVPLSTKNLSQDTGAIEGAGFEFYNPLGTQHRNFGNGMGSYNNVDSRAKLRATSAGFKGNNQTYSMGNDVISNRNSGIIRGEGRNTTISNNNILLEEHDMASKDVNVLKESVKVNGKEEGKTEATYDDYLFKLRRRSKENYPGGSNGITKKFYPPKKVDAGGLN